MRVISTPKKRFGQHFLHDRHVVERIIRAFSPRSGEQIVEIGPGRGALTGALLAHSLHLHAVELDRDLLTQLQATYGAYSGFCLHQGDALHFDFSRLVAPEKTDAKLRLIGNLPYNISTPLLFHLLDQSRCIHNMVFMLQKEVVDRLCAPPGGKEYGRLSVMIQWRCQVEKLFDVPPGAFTPPPKVISSVVRLTPYDQPLVSVHDAAVFAEVVRCAFSQRRKTLRNTLKELIAPDTMQKLGIDPIRRAETLTLAEFAMLANAVDKGAGSGG